MDKSKEEIKPVGMIIRFDGIAYRFTDYEKFWKMIRKNADEVYPTTVKGNGISDF